MTRGVSGARAAGTGEDAGCRRRIGEPHDEQRRGDNDPSPVAVALVDAIPPTGYGAELMATPRGRAQLEWT
jgi:hypothetical protein